MLYVLFLAQALKCYQEFTVLDRAFANPLVAVAAISKTAAHRGLNPKEKVKAIVVADLNAAFDAFFKCL